MFGNSNGQFQYAKFFFTESASSQRLNFSYLFLRSMAGQRTPHGQPDDSFDIRAFPVHVPG